MDNLPTSTPVKPSKLQAAVHWFTHLPPKQKLSLLTLFFLIISIPIAVIATYYQIRNRSKAGDATPSISLAITPPEQLINSVIKFYSDPNINLSAINTASFNPNHTGSTIEFWIKFYQPSQLKAGIANFSAADRQISITLDAITTTNQGIIFTTLPQFQDQRGISFKTEPLSPDTWYHYALVHNHSSKTVTLYINGLEVKSQPYDAPYNLLETVPQINIGSVALTHRGIANHLTSFSGFLEDFRLSSTPRQIDPLYLPPFNELVADEYTQILWKFNRSNMDHSIYNIPWNPSGYFEYADPYDQPSHFVCSETNQCISIAGMGENTCLSDLDCAAPPSRIIELGCQVGGCSGQLCHNETSTPPKTTCEFKLEYGCYHTANCEKQTSGNCGWTQTPELLACLSQYIATPSASPTVHPTSSPTPSPTPSPTSRPNDPTPTPTPNNNQQGQSGNSNPTNSTACTDQSPTHPADLFQINTNKTEAAVYFAPAGQPNTHYIIQYGEGTTMQHSANFNAQNATGVLKADIYFLKPNTVYSFQILALNHCAPGTWSNKMTVKTTSGASRTFYKNVATAVTNNFNRVLGTITSKPKVAPTKLQPIEVPSNPTQAAAQPEMPTYQPPQPQPNFFQRIINSIASIFSRS